MPTPREQNSNEPSHLPLPPTTPQSILRPPQTPTQPPRTPQRCPLRTNLDNDFQAVEEPVDQPSQCLPIPTQSSPSPARPNPSSTQQIPQSIQDNPTQPSVQENPIPTPQATRRSNRTRKAPERFADTEHSTMSIINLTSKKIRVGQYNDCNLHNLNWDKSNIPSSVDYSAFYSANVARTIDPCDGTMDNFHPLLLSAKANAEDNPTWNEATNGPMSDGFWKAMDIELETLTRKDAWTVVDRTDDMNVLESTWAYKVKRYPDGTIRKLKARFCVRGYLQIEGVDFFDTYAPVVSWLTVRIVMIISLILRLESVQVDYTAAFIQAPIDDEVYVEMPRGYREHGKVYKLNRGLYGLKQAARNFFLYLQDKLEEQGFKQSNLDACLFLHERMLVLVYIDDCIFFSSSKEDITDMLKKLRDSGLEMEPEQDIAGFLGVLIKRQDKQGIMELTQTGLISRVIESMGLTGSNAKQSPSEKTPLIADREGEPCNESFNFSSVVGMLSYLAGHTRPDIEYAVHQCGRYSHRPRAIHETALKRIS